MRQFRIYYLATDDTRYWARDIEVADDEAWDDACTQLQALPNAELFPAGVALDKANCEFTSALELDENGYKGEVYSVTPREVTELTQPEPHHFPQTEIISETVFGRDIRRVVTGLASGWKKHRNSAERAKVGLSVGGSSGQGVNGKAAAKGGVGGIPAPPDETD